MKKEVGDCGYLKRFKIKGNHKMDILSNKYSLQNVKKPAAAPIDGCTNQVNLKGYRESLRHTCLRPIQTERIICSRIGRFNACVKCGHLENSQSSAMENENKLGRMVMFMMVTGKMAQGKEKEHGIML